MTSGALKSSVLLYVCSALAAYSVCGHLVWDMNSAEPHDDMPGLHLGVFVFWMLETAAVQVPIVATLIVVAWRNPTESRLRAKAIAAAVVVHAAFAILVHDGTDAFTMLWTLPAVVTCGLWAAIVAALEVHYRTS